MITESNYDENHSVKLQKVKRRVIKTKQKYSSHTAAELLGISISQFRRLAEQNITPAAWYENPHYKCAGECPLWAGADVRKLKLKIRKSSEQLARRRASAAKAVATKTAQIQAYVESVKIEVPTFEFDHLIDAACENYNERSFEFTASPSSDDAFLHRITVNYLRHCCTGYERELRRLAGRVGVSDAYVTLKCRILDEIANTYPELSFECSNQQGGAYREEYSS